MAKHLLVVEGAHDAAFFGRLLAARGFMVVTTLPAVPDFWIQAIPRTYPVRADLALERVISFPEIYCRAQDNITVGIVVANGDAGLLRALRDFLDLFEAPEFASVAIVLDTDWHVSQAERFAAFHAQTVPWNSAGETDGRPGFPLEFPEEPGSVRAGTPRVGIFQFPGDGAQGALEDVLLACAQHQHPILHDRAGEYLDAAHEAYRDPAQPDPLRASRKRSGSAKARCGIIANVLRPGSSLAVSIRDTTWMPEDENVVPQVGCAAAFLDALLNN